LNILLFSNILKRNRLPCCWHGQKALIEKIIKTVEDLKKENAKTNIIHI